MNHLARVWEYSFCLYSSRFLKRIKVTLETGKKVTEFSFNRKVLCQTILFAERDASSRFEVLAQVAEEMKGKGTIAYINCGYVVFK